MKYVVLDDHKVFVKHLTETERPLIMLSDDVPIKENKCLSI